MWCVIDNKLEKTLQGDLINLGFALNLFHGKFPLMFILKIVNILKPFSHNFQYCCIVPSGVCLGAIV